MNDDFIEKHSIWVFMLCGILFFLMLGIGYIIAGIIVAQHAMKKEWGMDSIGVIFVWPGAILLRITMDEEDKD